MWSNFTAGYCAKQKLQKQRSVLSLMHCQFSVISLIYDLSTLLSLFKWEIKYTAPFYHLMFCPLGDTVWSGFWFFSAIFLVCVINGPPGHVYPCPSALSVHCRTVRNFHMKSEGILCAVGVSWSCWAARHPPGAFLLFLLPTNGTGWENKVKKFMSQDKDMEII